jgi:hypothetical protein
MNVKDIQQAMQCSKTVHIACGPMTVRVHEALDASLTYTKHRYYLSVDFKMRPFDALNMGELGWLGMTKSEATREANDLAAKIHVTVGAIKVAQVSTMNGAAITLKRQEERLEQLVGKYSAEIV